MNFFVYLLLLAAVSVAAPAAFPDDNAAESANDAPVPYVVDSAML